MPVMALGGDVADSPGTLLQARDSLVAGDPTTDDDDGWSGAEDVPSEHPAFGDVSPLGPPPAPAAGMRSFWRGVVGLVGPGKTAQGVSILSRHFLAFLGLRRLLSGTVGWPVVALAGVLWVVSGLGVTAGAHRLWSHQSYQASPAMEALLMVMFSMADQGTIAGWSLTHAMHHACSDTDQDPHNRMDGWWHAHFGWLCSTHVFKISAPDYDRVMAGLGPAVHFHDKLFLVWDPLLSLGLPALICHLCWGDAVGGFLVAGALRWAFVQHVTFFVNSIAHGEREPGESYAFDPAAEGIGPRVSLLTTLFALGEGWHDYHHMFHWDYAAAELDAWHQWNPTKVFIDLCHAVGLVDRRRRCSDRLQLEQRQRLDSRSAGRRLRCTYELRGLPFLRQRVLAAAGEEEEAANGDARVAPAETHEEGGPRQRRQDKQQHTSARMPGPNQRAPGASVTRL